ncbi:MAG: HD domain-containing protein [Clostridia bacterium]|nr:HD domain-containing protein [Clostridia bacterium]
MPDKKEMEFDFNGILFALSYALDCVEHDLLGVTSNHGKRVAAIAMCVGNRMGVLTTNQERQILSACAVMHDCALSEYIQDEYDGSYVAATGSFLKNFGRHCTMGEEAMKLMPFDPNGTKNVVLYHHENADGSGPFRKKADEIPQAARLIQIADTIDATFDLSWMDDDKRQRVRNYLNDQIGHLFAREEAEAFIDYINGIQSFDLSFLRNEKIDIFLHNLLPGGTVTCTPRELMDFAGVFARIVDYKSHFTKNHSIGIAQKVYKMALYYQADENLAAKLFFAGALHDIGKLVVDRDILEKPDQLNHAEYKHIQTHVYYTYKILSDVSGLEDITKWAAYHHEKLDGTGYPFSLSTKDLGHWDRLMACLDIYQALTEERPYKKGMSHEDAVDILRKMAEDGKLDAQIVADINQIKP